MSSSDRFGELRSMLTSSPDEDHWARLVAKLEAWPDERARDEVAWPYAVDRLRDLGAPPMRAPLRLARLLFDGVDTHDEILGCGELAVTPFDRAEVECVAGLLRRGLRVIEIELRGSDVYGDRGARAALLASFTPALERVSLENLTAELDLEPLRVALERAQPRALALRSNHLDDDHFSSLMTPAVVAPLEHLDVSWNWSSYDERCGCLSDVTFSGLRGLVLEGVDLGSDGVEGLIGNASLVGVERLDLNMNDLDDLSVERVAASPLARGLVDLDLGFNTGFGDQGVAALARAPMPALRRLVLSSSGLTGVGARALSQAPWRARLEHLDLSFCESMEPEALLPLLSSTGLSSLRSLELDYIEALDDGLLAELVAGSLGGGLERLSLMSTGAGDLVARAIASRPEAFTSLNELNLSSDALTNAGVEALTSCAHLNLEQVSLTSDSLDSDAVMLVARSRWSPVSLQLAPGTMDDHALEALARWPGLARLRELDLYGAAASLDSVAVLLDSPSLGALDVLGLSGFSADPDDLLELLASRRSLSALGRLFISESALPVTTRGYAALASSPYMRNLRALTADLDSISPEGSAILAASPHLSGAVRVMPRWTTP